MSKPQSVKLLARLPPANQKLAIYLPISLVPQPASPHSDFSAKRYDVHALRYP